MRDQIGDEMTMEWPQSGERFRGVAKVLGAMGAVQVKPHFAGTPRLIGSGDIWVLMVPLRYGEEKVLQGPGLIASTPLVESLAPGAFHRNLMTSAGGGAR